MNVVITDGVVLMPPPFAGGLEVWSSEDGRPGQATYDGAANAALVPADQDFAGCLELVKTDAVQKLRYAGNTPILPGVYLRITARVKAISGNLPSVRIAGWAGTGSNSHVAGLVEIGPAVTLTSYGEVVEVSAIVGSGNRQGVDMVWAKGTSFGHFGLDLTGANGGVVRVDDIVIEDITEAFLRVIIGTVDVRDYGAVGDGVTDDRAAFLAADADADGRVVSVPEGTFFLADDTTLESVVRFAGHVTLPAAKRLVLTQNFNLPDYIDAFGGDEMEGFRRALQALLNFSDHDSLDMRGRRIEITEPIDVQAAEGNITTFENRRVVRNGQFNVIAGTAWNSGTATSTAAYNPNNPKKLTAVANIAQIEVGSLVSGAGVGREVYVSDRNVGAGTLTLSQPLYGAATSQSYTFTRFRYVLDFSGFAKCSRFTLEQVEFLCNGVASGILLPADGEQFHMHDVWMNRAQGPRRHQPCRRLPGSDDRRLPVLFQRAGGGGQRPHLDRLQRQPERREDPRQPVPALRPYRRALRHWPPDRRQPLVPGRRQHQCAAGRRHGVHPAEREIGDHRQLHRQLLHRDDQRARCGAGLFQRIFLRRADPDRQHLHHHRRQRRLRLDRGEALWLGAFRARAERDRQHLPRQQRQCRAGREGGYHLRHAGSAERPRHRVSGQYLQRGGPDHPESGLAVVPAEYRGKKLGAERRRLHAVRRRSARWWNRWWRRGRSPMPPAARSIPCPMPPPSTGRTAIRCN